MSKYNLIDIYEQYQIGSGWTRDFDYDGMLKAGLKTGVDTDLELLKKMVEDYTDVNYHREAHHLYKAIEALEDGATKEASMFFGDFHAEIKNTMEEQGMDIEPTVGQFMASKMEENKEAVDLAIEASQEKAGIKEVTSREGSRIEGLLDRGLKSKFLEAFSDLYFDLVEEDPFMAEDVVDHLSIEMLKHLDAIQAQGDKLAGVNTDADFEREQRAQLDMREEDVIEDEPVTEDSIEEADNPEVDALLDKIRKHLKGSDRNFQDNEIEMYIDSLDRDIKRGEFDGVESISMEDHEEDLENYIADKSLQEHFGRFMKDYQ